MNYAQYYATGGTGPRPTSTQPAYKPMTNEELVRGNLGSINAGYGNRPLFGGTMQQMYNAGQGFALPYGQQQQQPYGQMPYNPMQWARTGAPPRWSKRNQYGYGGQFQQQMLPYSPQGGWGFQQFQQQPQQRFVPYQLDASYQMR